MDITVDEYNKLFPVGTVVLPVVFCTNSFTMNMFEEEKKKSIVKELNSLNANNYNAMWEYKENLGIVRIK